MHIAKQLMFIWLYLNSTGVWGHAPRKNLKIKTTEIESESIFNGLLPGLLQDTAHCRIISVQLFGKVVDYIISRSLHQSMHGY